ncbi:sugar phosphorylase [Thiomicrorhabdus lithotrophica]|uniref:Sugar phosphorylase n=1 Tax=Thiomicrorhabdus lithotrophica TaxID=2949997 RepID=A0ABY8CCP1_9GAMM|nr:sugar phosphorylase [Thiomicrorhabdus lithotrophica]WEJ62557.1 sugar phosphorylase [Thiomicrorhabdus lithotrophica]
MTSDQAYSALIERISPLVEALYPNEDAIALAHQFAAKSGIDKADCVMPVSHQSHWSEQDVMVITYGDSVVNDSEKPLKTLKKILDRFLKESVSMVHILPYYPYTSDGGFAVSDYEIINPDLGDWNDIGEISQAYKIMADLVVNHCSSEHPWFKAFESGDKKYENYFVQASPEDDLSEVVRPRTTPLLRLTRTPEGDKYVWCTFSHDQIDLNFSNPEVFLEVMRLISMYIDKGASIFRLDAIGFLWKIIGTSCIHLPETHQAIQLMRALIEYRLSDAIIITETNVPKRENLTYFGNGNEAHMVYNFSLPPLLVNALLTGSAKHLKTWLMSMPPAQLGTTFLNFIASHDGIGVRPAEGILDPEELQNMIHALQSFGAQVSWRTGLNGEKHPYEINIALFDAFKGTCEGEDDYQVERMLCAHAIAIALEGVPAIYIHSFFATENDYESLEKTEHNRDINRHQWQEDALTPLLEDVNSKHYAVLSGLNRLIALRKKHAAFHPNATQFTLHLDDALFGFWRQSLTRHQSVFVINNVTNQSQTFSLAQLNLIDMDEWKEIITDQMITDLYGEMVLAPYQAVWITNRW